MSNITLNEYVHEHLKLPTEDGLFKVFYEPCENKPVTGLTGAIYLGGELAQTFHVRDEREVVVSPTGRKRKAIYGHFIPAEGVILLYWERDPGEHFLCVSYEFGDGQIEVSIKPNWLREGF